MIELPEDLRADFGIVTLDADGVRPLTEEILRRDGGIVWVQDINTNQYGNLKLYMLNQKGVTHRMNIGQYIQHVESGFFIYPKTRSALTLVSKLSENAGNKDQTAIGVLDLDGNEVKLVED